MIVHSTTWLKAVDGDRRSEIVGHRASGRAGGAAGGASCGRHSAPITPITHHHHCMHAPPHRPPINPHHLLLDTLINQISNAGLSTSVHTALSAAGESVLVRIACAKIRCQINRKYLSIRAAASIFFPCSLDIAPISSPRNNIKSSL